MKRFARALVTSALSLAACTRLPEIGDRECGNGVIEPPEDCDTFGDDAGALCRPKGSVGECHLDCSRGAAERSVCPAGWGCDLGGICRPPTGSFEPPREYEVGAAALLSSADFDGDGRQDVLSAEPFDPFGVTRIKFHYFDERGTLAETRSFPHQLLSPAVAQMNGDPLADVLFTDARVGMLLGRADRSWLPETFSSYRIPGTAIRTLTALDAPVDGGPAFVVFAVFGDQGPGVYIPDAANSGFPRQLGTLPTPIDALVGDPVAGQVIEGAPCRQAFLAVTGESRFSMLDFCTVGPAGAPRWRPEVSTQLIELDPPDAIALPPQVVDMNGDGHLDVIVGSAERAFVAYGDGSTLATAVPYELTAGDAGLSTMPMPLAAGDVTGDGRVDFVFPDGLLLSGPSSLPTGGQYTPVFGGQRRWTVAAIADVNANGLLDIVAGSSERPGLELYNGTGSADLTYFPIATSRPVQRIGVGDFDGDLVEDVAFTQSGGGVGTDSQVMISFGVPFGPPLPGVAVARLANVEQMTTYREAKLSHLLIASSEDDGVARRGVLTLLTGSGDRLPVALYELTTFAADSSVNGSNAARVLGGAFTSTVQGDVLALAFNGLPADAGLQFWLLPALASSPGTPSLLAGGLPADVHPVVGNAEGLSLAGAGADLDGDGRDEALLAMPGEDEGHCALIALGVETDRVLEKQRLAVAEPCARIELAALDGDSDGRADVVWLTGRADGSDRRLSIFWNDGAGGLSAEARSIISDHAASPQAFAVLKANAGRGAGVAYATPFGVELVSFAAATRELGAAEPLAALAGATGLTAADVNGDGTVDLVAASGGNLQVLAAGLDPL